MASALPPGWTRYTTDEGKEYFHNAVTDITQWDRPSWPEASTSSAAGPLESTMADVFTYNPTESDLTASSGAGSQAIAPMPSVQGASNEAELVSLTAAPGGRLAANSPGGSNNAGGGGAARGGGDADLFSGFGLGGILGGTMDGGAAAAGSAEQGTQSWLLSYAQNLFDVSTADVVQRLKLVLIPSMHPSGQATEDLKLRPDFYGPFWVATTAILFLAATGNFARLIEVGSHHDFKADYSLVSLAAGTIYGCLLGVPLIARGTVFFSGDEAGPVDLKQLVCVCGYSLAPAIPVSMLCLIPAGFLRWVAVLAGLAASLLFVKTHLLADIHATAPWLKWTMTIAPCVLPVVVFLMYRVHFFTSAP